ncbi:MAG: 4-hydroxy-tetrahydrodipicolinate reductase [Clostridia bacterium]|nr:4-hydroxy-tetrahydrodipicolinate reductase [Clostridia bacterium]
MRPLRIILSGCSGRLGTVVARIAAERDDLEIVCGVDLRGSADFPVKGSFAEVDTDADVIIDISHHTVIGDVLAYAKAHALPVVICTTGHTDEEDALIKDAAKYVPILKSRNMSLGINLMMELVRRTAATLGEEFDIEIVEAHHNKKLDAPSGTALMLADAARDVREDAEYIYDRHSVRREREKREIGIHSIRGGTIVGEHSVIFAGRDEVITLSHSAGSRDLFAAGAVKAAIFLKGAKPGYYTMNDVVKELV